MKKLMVLLGLSFLSLNLAFADYKLMIIRGDGVQSEQCIKSYTFSNNLESLNRQHKLYNEIYSSEENITNKIWINTEGVKKRVYRKVLQKIPLPDNNFSGHSLNLLSIEQIVNLETRINDFKSGYFIENTSEALHQSTFITFKDNKYKLFLDTRGKYNSQRYTANVIIEYTKTTDLADNSLDSFKSYIHYIPSNSEDKGIITEEINNAGVQILDSYIYDKDLESCTKK